MIYTQKPLPPRHEHDHYCTPSGAVLQVLQWFKDQGRAPPASLLDLGAGDGVYGRVARLVWPGIHLTGVEVREVTPPPEYDAWITADLASWEPAHEYDLVAANPPFYLAERCVWLALSALSPAGTAILLSRLSFLAGQHRRRALYAEGLLRQVVVCSKRLSFDNTGKTNATDHAHFVWRRGSVRPPQVHFLA